MQAIVGVVLIMGLAIYPMERKVSINVRLCYKVFTSLPTTFVMIVLD